MRGPEAAGLSAENTQSGLAPFSKAGTERRCDEPNQQEGFLQDGYPRWL